MKSLSHTVPQTPTQKLKSGFSTSSSQGIASSLVLFEMIFEVPQSELFKFQVSENPKNHGNQPTYIV